MRKNNGFYLIALSLAILLTTVVNAGAKSFLDSLDEAVNSIDRSVNDLNKSLDKIGGDINKSLDRNAVTAKGVSITNSGSNVNKSVNTTINGVGNQVTRISNDTVVIVENGKKTVYQTKNGTLTSSADGVSKTVSGVSDQVNNTVSKATRALDKMSGDLDRIFGDINKSVGDAGRQIEKTAGGVVTTTKTTVDNAGNVVTNTTNSINSGATRIMNNEQVIAVTNGQSRNIGGRISEVIGSVNNAINPMANQNSNPPVNTPVNRINPNAVSGNPETVFSEKALEGMALLGDRWAKLKLDEIRAKKMSDMLYTKYKSISWLNIFKKLGAYSDYKNANKYYLNAAEQVRQYEVANPNSGGIVQGIDQINESLLEFKAMFGDKKAQAQLEVIRAKREYEKIKLQYDSAGLIEKLKYRGELKYAEARYQEALKVFENVSRGGAVVSGNGLNDGVTVVDNAADVRGNNYTNTNAVTSTGRIYNNTDALAVAKSRMDAAYKNYINYMGQPNPIQSKLDQLQKEYMSAVETFQNIAHGNGR